MRQGPSYSQWVDIDKDGGVFLRPPLEISDYLSNFKSITWIDRGDGSFLLKPERDFTGAEILRRHTRPDND